MPFYKIDEMEKVLSRVGRGFSKTTAGELIKVGVVTYMKGEMPPPHVHPNEEQFMLMLEGKVRMFLGEEVRTIGPGELVHIPRNTNHGIHIVEEPAVFFAAKSPVGDGNLDQDYHKAEGAEEIAARLAAETV